jgi:hypothetical protein
MKAVAVFLLFLGTILILQGYYSQKKEEKECPKQTVQIKYVPRSVYQEQINAGANDAVTRHFKGMFLDPSVTPWFDVNDENIHPIRG